MSDLYFISIGNGLNMEETKPIHGSELRGYRGEQQGDTRGRTKQDDVPYDRERSYEQSYEMPRALPRLYKTLS